MRSREQCGAVVWLSMACFLSIVGSAGAQSATEIAQAIQAGFAKNADLGNVTLTMRGAVVTLAGEAPSLYTRGQAIDFARRTGGVESVVNNVIIPAAESDQAIAEAMVRALRAYPHLTIWDHVDGVVDNGVVTLEGMVTPYRDKTGDIGLEVAKVPGIQEIRLNLHVMSPSAGDDRLRSAIARRLISRGDPFDRFESMPNPPIRILVDNSVVVLLGYLGNRGDNLELQRIVAQTQGVLRVENHVVTR